MRKRTQRWFGTRIPEWRGEKYGSGATTIRFVLTGKIISKKNNNQAFAIRKPAINFLQKTAAENGVITLKDAIKAVNMVKGKLIGNTEYKTFLKKCVPIVQAQAAEWSARLGEKGLIFPLQKSTLTLRLYFKDAYITDSANKLQTLQDLLVEAGIIVNDDRKSLNPIHCESADYYKELVHNIAFISLTFRLHKHIPLI